MKLTPELIAELLVRPVRHFTVQDLSGSLIWADFKKDLVGSRSGYLIHFEGRLRKLWKSEHGSSFLFKFDGRHIRVAEEWHTI